jgi:hypothetical protein
LSQEELPPSRPIFIDFLKSRIFLKWLSITGLFSVSVFVTLYGASGGFSFLSSSSDLAWLKAARVVMGELSEGQSQFPNLFTYAVVFMGRFIKDSFLALKITTFLVNLTLVGAVFFLSTRLTRDLKVGVLSSLLLSLHPSIISVLQISAYQVVIGLAWVSIALCVLMVDFPGKRPYGLVLITILSVLAAVSDPLAGLIIVVVSFLTAPTKTKNVLSIDLVDSLAALPSGIVGAILILFYRSSFTLPEMTIDPVIPALALITAFFGGILLYRRQRLQGLKLLISWLVASIVVPSLLNVPILTAVAVYALPSLLILGSALVLNIDQGMIKTVGKVVTSNRHRRSKEPEKLLEMDITKLGCVILLVLLGFYSMMSNYMVYAEVNTVHGLEWERYGDLELREAMTWINFNTPQNAVVVVENPLSDWVEAFGGRTSLANSYVTDSILSANYEIRNLFLRLRDWGPIAPQRVPFFAVSDGENFVNFLYVDESHAKLTYNLNGSLYIPDFYDYTICSSGWIKRSSEIAILRHIFEVEGVSINKTMWLSKDAAEASIEYVIEERPNASLQEFALKAWVPWERRLGFTEISGSEVELSLDVGDFLISFEGNLLSVDFKPDKEWSQMRVEAIFTPTDNHIYAKMTVKALTAKPIEWGKDEVVAYATTELMAQYRVAYVIVPTIVKKQGMDRFGLDFPKFLSMFENSKLTVYKIIL